MSSRIVTGFVVLGGLGLTRLVLHPVEEPVWSAIQDREPALRFESDVAAPEQAVVVGLLGGLRAMVADVLWLKASQLAEERNLPATEAALRLVSSIDSRSLYFWINGARIMAYDMPAWRVSDAGGYDHVPIARQRHIVEDQARRALAHLAEAMKFHPASSALWIERANIELNRLGDLPAAAASYRRGWEQPGAPFYAARLHGELLRRMGRKTAALAWLIQLHPELPRNDESAGADLVLSRIRTLERELGISAERAYRPASRAAP